MDIEKLSEAFHRASFYLKLTTVNITNYAQSVQVAKNEMTRLMSDMASICSLVISADCNSNISISVKRCCQLAETLTYKLELLSKDVIEASVMISAVNSASNHQETLDKMLPVASAIKQIAKKNDCN
jgi:hypothetical protein